MNCKSKTCRYLATEPVASALNGSPYSAFCSFLVSSLPSMVEKSFVEPGQGKTHLEITENYKSEVENTGC